MCPPQGQSIQFWHNLRVRIGNHLLDFSKIKIGNVPKGFKILKLKPQRPDWFFDLMFCLLVLKKKKTTPVSDISEAQFDCE